MKLTNTRITTLILMLLAVVFLALSGCSSDGDDRITNTAPEADAGIAQHIKTTSLVTLDGSGSYDADHDSLTYDWSMTSRPAGSGAALSGADTSHPTFTADKDGDYVFELIVNDGLFDSRNDESVTVTATHVGANATPVAVAGPDQHVKTASLVTLDGSGSSDADHDLLTYLWSIQSKPAGSSATLSGATTSHPTFTADVGGDYRFELIVNDGTVDSTPATVTVTATHVDANAIPVAVANADKLHPKTLELVTLDGSGSSDADGDTLTYSWWIQSAPSGSSATLSDTSSSHPIFTPVVEGAYTFKLIVNDGKVDSAPATVTVTATHVDANAKPVAVASADELHPKSLELVTLDGSGSSDADGDPLTYRWTIQSRARGSMVALSDANLVDPTFTPDVWGSYVFKLIVNDGHVDSAADYVTVFATPGCGGDPSDPSQCVFATSTTHNGNLGGLSGADATCTDFAKAVNLGGAYKAWLSAGSTSPYNRFSVDRVLPFRLTSGITVADNWDHLTSNHPGLHHQINVTEANFVIPTDPRTPAQPVWTNTGRSGIAVYQTGWDCSSWTSSASTFKGLVGDLTATTLSWTNTFNSLLCDTPARLYCFEQLPLSPAP